MKPPSGSLGGGILPALAGSSTPRPGQLVPGTGLCGEPYREPGSDCTESLPAPHPLSWAKWDREPSTRSAATTGGEEVGRVTPS